jgi:hypothetical protein
MADRGVIAALDHKYRAIVDLEVALRAKLTGTSSDDEIRPILDLLENEAQAIDAVVDGNSDPTIDTLSPSDAAALLQAVQKAETEIAQAGSVEALLNAANLLIGTIRQG